MKAFAELLEATRSEERARLCIERTFTSEDNFTRTKRCQPWEIATDANKLLADIPCRKPNGKAPRQPNDTGPARWTPQYAHSEGL